LTTADNIGYLIPTTIIDHFLTDIEDGAYHGFGKFGITLFPGLHNPYYKQYLKIPDEVDGVVVTDVLRNSTTYGTLKAGDVLTKIGDFNIDNDGRIMIDGLSLEMSEILDRRQIGDTLTLTYYRDGEKQQQELTIAENEPVIPWDLLYDTRPDYRVFAGLTFVQLNRNFLETWGSKWIAEIPFHLRYLFIESNQLNDRPERKEYIVLSEILPDEINAYLDGYQNQVVETVNNLYINELDDLDKAFLTDLNGYWVVTFWGHDTPLIVDAAQARQRHSAILNKYQVPEETPTHEKEFLF
jgi:hypothetical protein